MNINERNEMEINSTLHRKLEKESYPCVMANTITGEVVIFHAQGRGMVLITGPDPQRPVGYNSDHWKKENFELLERGSFITITV